jgi:WD40 repeat protein
MAARFSLLLFIPLLIAIYARAQPAVPILRLENGMHTAKSSRIATDAAGKYLLTCSDDKTARLWDASTGKLLHTYRIPIGGIDEGKIYSCALSPDGRYAVLGGWTGWEWDAANSVYVVQVQTGVIVKRIKGMSSVINDLEFSPDGKWLGIALSGTSGFRVYKTDDWSEFKSISTGYEAQISNLAFDKSNRLATVSYDGKLRLYNAQITLIKEIKLTAGERAYSLAFTPDNLVISIAYSDVPDVELRSSADLSLLYKPDVSMAASRGESLNKLCFSNDGKRLFAGGSYAVRDSANEWKYVVRSWGAAGRGTFKDVLVMNNVVMDIKPLPNGTVAVVGSNPDLALLSADGDIIWYTRSCGLDFSSRDKTHFQVNNAGSVFSCKPIDGQPIMFDVLARMLTEENSSYKSPTSTNGGTEVTDWLATSEPKINGIPFMNLSAYERAISTDVSADGKSVLIGADWYLYKANENGEQAWFTSLPEVAYAVNITGNGKLAMALLGDGSIHWYDMVDGKELLTFFLHSDRKRWIIFSSSGYYDASPGAEDLAGWHLNNGPDSMPDYFPLSRFHNTYYRPDVIDAIFETYSESEAIVLANRRNRNAPVASVAISTKLPPVVSITSPSNGSSVNTELVRVSYNFKSADGTPVRNVRILVNGRPIAVQRGIDLQASDKQTVEVVVPRGESTITVLAENDNGVSPEANLVVKYQPEETGKKSDVLLKSRLYVLAIGISAYSNPDYKLSFAQADADAFVESIKKQKGKLYGDVVVRPLIDAKATRENIQDGLQWIQEHTIKGDVAMIFFAGHGINDNNGVFYMLPVGADVTRLRSTCLNFEELRQTVGSIAGNVVVFIDACHSGNAMGSTRTGTDINAFVNQMSNTQTGAITFTSSTGKEYSLEDPEWQHGAFTRALIEGLAGNADILRKGEITVKGLDYYISERVKELTKGRQHPTTVVPPNVPNFQIGVTF